MESEEAKQQRLMNELNEATAKLHEIIYELYFDRDKKETDKPGDNDMHYTHILNNNLGHQILLQMQVVMPKEELRIQPQAEIVKELKDVDDTNVADTTKTGE